MPATRWTVAISLIVIGWNLNAAWGVLHEPARSGLVGLPAEVVRALVVQFPRALIVGSDVVPANGQVVYDVQLQQTDQTSEVTIAPNGRILSVTTRVPPVKVPSSVLAAITQIAPDARVLWVAETEVWGEVRGGFPENLSPLRYTYEARLIHGRTKTQIRVSREGNLLEIAPWSPLLPPAALAAVTRACPNARLVDTIAKVEQGVRLHVAQLARNRAVIEIEVTDGGTIRKVRAPVATDRVPPLVKRALAEAIPAGEIQEITRTTTCAGVLLGNVVPLPAPNIVYDARYTRLGVMGQVEVDAQGRLLAKR